MTPSSSGTTHSLAITGAILAGGRATRMNGEDKGLVMLDGRPMIAYTIDALRPQVAELIINANRHRAVYGRLGQCGTVADDISGFAGPLAGMATTLQVAGYALVLVVPCDSPLIAQDLSERLHAALLSTDADIAVATDGQRLQPVFALLRRRLLPSMLDFLTGGERKIDRWYAMHDVVEVNFSDRSEMFYNINTPDDRLRMEQQLRRSVSC